MAMDIRNDIMCNGDINVMTIQDPGIDANTVLEINQDWSVIVTWDLFGPSADLLTTLPWHVQLIVESMGSGQENMLAAVTVGGGSVTPIAGGYRYEVKIKVPAKNPADPQHTIQTEGVYKLVTVVTHDHVSGKKDRVAGFREGPMVQFYSFN